MKNNFSPKGLATLATLATNLLAEVLNKPNITGYGCGRCGENNYRQVKDGWQCQGCGAAYQIIGGSRGPKFHHRG